MKHIIIFIALSPIIIRAQDHTLSLNARYGISTSNFQIIDPIIDSKRKFMEMRSIRDMGVAFQYKRRVHNKYNLWLYSGFDYSNATHYQTLTEPRYRTHLDNIIINTSRIDFNLGLKKRFTLKKDYLSLDIGAALVFRQFFNESKTYAEGLHFKNEDWIEFSYSLTTYHGKWYENNLPESFSGRFGKELSGTLNFKLSQKSSLNFGFNYITRNTFFHDYIYSVNYYLNNSSTPSYSFTSFGFIDGTKFGVNDNYLYLNIGYTYQLKNKRKGKH